MMGSACPSGAGQAASLRITRRATSIYRKGTNGVICVICVITIMIIIIMIMITRIVIVMIIIIIVIIPYRCLNPSKLMECNYQGRGLAVWPLLGHKGI